MKKTIILLAIAILEFISCNKTPIPESKDNDLVGTKWVTNVDIYTTEKTAVVRLALFTNIIQTGQTMLSSINLKTNILLSALTKMNTPLI